MPTMYSPPIFSLLYSIYFLLDILASSSSFHLAFVRTTVSLSVWCVFVYFRTDPVSISNP